MVYAKEIEIRNELLALAEEKYQKFSVALIPGCDNLLGVRIPLLRNIAKSIIKDQPFDYLHKAKEVYFEETMVKAFIIGNLKEDIEVVLKEVELHIPKITNWSLCDSFCAELKIVRKHKERVWEFLQKYSSSNNAYDIRFAIVLLLFHFIEENYIDEILVACDKIKHTDYYVKMAVAWCISICFVKFPAKTMDYLKNNTLDDDTYNKALSKIVQSLRVEAPTKELIKSMRRKNNI